MDSNNLEHLTQEMYNLVYEVSDFINNKAKPALDLAEFTGVLERETTVYLLFSRVWCHMLTLKKLDQPTDYQAVSAINRSLLEIAVDLIFFCSDKTSLSAEKLSWWEKSAALVASKTFADYEKASGGNVPKQMQEAITNNEPLINQQRLHLWPRKNGVPKHPDRWTGRNLWEDIDYITKNKLEEPTILKIIGNDLRKIYKQTYKLMCWNTHGSGATFIRQAARSSEGIDLVANIGHGYLVGAELAAFCTTLALNDFGLIREVNELEHTLHSLHSNLATSYNLY